MTMNPEAVKLVTVRLSERADRLLRKKVERKGDVSRLISDAIAATDFAAIEVTPRKRQPGGGRQTFITTSVKLVPEVHEALAATAKLRGVSTSALLDAIIIGFYGSGKPKPS